METKLKTTETTICNGVLKISIGNQLYFKGDILIIDPCYLEEGLLEDNWDEFVDMMFNEDGSGKVLDNQNISNYGILTINGAKILYTGTAYGDGVYPVSTSKKIIGFSCGVDAGMLCIIHMDDLYKVSKNTDEITKLGVVVKDVDCNIYADGEGNFTSPQVNVYTDDRFDET